jgi:hypothetical protein
VATFPQSNEWAQLAATGISPAQLMSGELTTAQLTQLKSQLAVWATVLDQRLTEIGDEQEQIETVLAQIDEALDRIDTRVEEGRQARRARREGEQPGEERKGRGRRKGRAAEG